MALVGCVPLSSDPCVYVLDSGDELTFLATYVDDRSLLGSNIGVLKMLRGARFAKTDIYERRLCGAQHEDQPKPHGIRHTGDQSGTLRQVCAGEVRHARVQPIDTTGYGPELSLHEPGEKDAARVQRYQAATRSLMFLEQRAL